MSGAGVLRRSHSWSTANCEEIITLLRGSDYLCLHMYICCFCSASVCLHLPYETQQNPASAERRIRVRLSPDKSASNNGREVGIQNSGMPGLFSPKRPSGKYEKAVRLGKEKSNRKPCATPVSVHSLFQQGQNCLQDKALGGGWMIFPYSMINSEGHKCQSFVCSMQPWKDGLPASLLGS